ncbi:hypothetical protein N7532_007385 [Penicillium argentinense]|uniref:Uncharacterized protein n=1 Tax=Penicillium argentinense TaxID=1131581 RepID=A0A9W9F7L9_9EURO|nr:uncharacterized protein N7532_007385 [Penicillium argentinense]KAJ5095094.1 hypothetical protein N7532_007385 [Penicillium argentinense]
MAWPLYNDNTWMPQNQSQSEFFPTTHNNLSQNTIFATLFEDVPLLPVDQYWNYTNSSFVYL